MFVWKKGKKDKSARKDGRPAAQSCLQRKGRPRNRAIGFESLESRKMLSAGPWGGGGGGFGFGFGFGFGGGGGGAYFGSGGSSTSSTPTVATTIALTSSATTATYGQSVTLTATVTATSGTPRGLVQFTDGTNVIGTTPLQNGVATLNVSNLSVGAAHSITAQYLGNGTYIASAASTAASVTVTQASSITTLTAAHNPVSTGDAATYFITVSNGATSSTGGGPFGGGCGFGGLQGAAPSGTVTITAVEPGSSTPVTLGTAQLYNGRAIFSTTSLPAGTSTITATYNGDTNYTGSTSQSVSQSVGSTLASSVLSAYASSRPVVINTATSLTVNLNAGRSSTVGAAPSGTVTIYDATTGTTLTTTAASLAAVGTSTTKATASVPLTFTTSGVHLLVVTYSGDSNYATQQITIPVNVQSSSSSGRGGWGFWF